MIKSIQLDNFKSIEHSGEIVLAPITLVTGPNSSGKSSILKPLLLLKQTSDSRDMQRSIQIDGQYVQLGPFSQFVYRHDEKKEVKITLSFSTDRKLLWRQIKQTGDKIAQRYLEDIIPETIEVQVSLAAGAYDETITRQTQFSFTHVELGRVIVIKTRGPRGSYSGTVSIDNEPTKFTPNRKSKFYDMVQSIRAQERFNSSRTKLGNNLPRLLSYLTRTFEIDASKIFYLGPLRDEPAPLYSASSERPQDVGISGADTPSVLWTGRGETKQIELKRKVDKWMDTFEISKKIKLHRVGPFFQIILYDWHSGISSNLPNVGFGASQLLPVIVAGYYTPIKSLLILEQPEIHLHPKAQSNLADLLIDISNENKKILAETHSEHLIMRIQRRIAEGTLDNNKVALYYCQPSNKSTKIKRIHIDQYGQLDIKLPSGFFDESYWESKALLEAIVKKRSQEK